MIGGRGKIGTTLSPEETRLTRQRNKGNWTRKTRAGGKKEKKVVKTLTGGVRDPGKKIKKPPRSSGLRERRTPLTVLENILKNTCLAGNGRKMPGRAQ